MFGYSSNALSKEEKLKTLESNAKVQKKKTRPISRCREASSTLRLFSCMLTRLLQNQLALNLLGIACLAFVKMSALLFYKRIFCVSGRKAVFSIIITTSVGVVALWFVAMEMFVGFQCGTHYNANWKGNAAKYCTQVWPSNQGLAISDLILDIWALVLPIHPVHLAIPLGPDALPRPI